jgi:hypothetical protein
MDLNRVAYNSVGSIQVLGMLYRMLIDKGVLDRQEVRRDFLELINALKASGATPESYEPFEGVLMYIWINASSSP